MKIIVLNILIAVGWGINLTGQNALFSWAGQYADVSGGSSEITDMIVKSPGIGWNTYSCGYFSGTVDFDMQSGTSSLVSNGGTDVFITRQNEDGTLIWALSIGGSGDDSAWTIIEGEDNWLYIGGSFSSVVDFDPGAGIMNLTSGGNSDAFILKIDPISGAYEWAINIGEGAGNSATKCLYMLPDSTLYATGDFDGAVDLNSGITVSSYTSAGSTDVFVSTFDSDANYRRSSVFYGNGTDLAYDLVAQNDIIVVNGFFSDSIDADPTNGTSVHYASPGGSMFIARIDSTGAYGVSGQLETNHKVSMYYYDGVYRIVLAGTYLDSMDVLIDTTQSYLYSEHAGTYEGFALIYSVYLSFINDRFTFGGNGDDYPTAIGGRNSDVIIAGTTNSTQFDADVTGDTFLIPAGGDDIFALSFHNISYQLNNAGTAQNFSSNRSVLGADALYGSSGIEMYLGGGFNLSPDFDPVGNYSLSTQGFDAYQSKWIACGPVYAGTGFQTCNSVFVYNNHSYSVPGNYTDTLTTVCGADSIISFSVTLFVHDTSVMVNGFTLTANQSQGNYQWVDCNNNYSPIAGANFQNFTPVTDGSYAVILTGADCSDTSSCHTILGIGMNEYFDFKPLVIPNPFDNAITVNNIEPGTVITIFNAIGEVIHCEKAQSNIHAIDTSKLPNGFYTVQTEINGKRTATRLVK